MVDELAGLNIYRVLSCMGDKVASMPSLPSPNAATLPTLSSAPNSGIYSLRLCSTLAFCASFVSSAKYHRRTV